VCADFRALRQEIEGKQTQIQVLIGSRYQDVIQAADGIADMHTAALHVQDLLNSIPAVRARAAFPVVCVS
jgi:hypothetical protein